MYICSTARLCYIAAHALIESRHDSVAATVLHISSVAVGNRCATGRTHTEHIHSHALLSGFLGSLNGSSLVVLTIGDDDDSLADAFLLSETVHCLRYGKRDVGALSGNQRGLDVSKKHLRRHIVARDRQLYKGVTGKYQESYFVVGEVIHEILHHHLATVETARCNILRKHRVADVHGNDSLDALSLLITYLGAKLRTSEHDDDKSKGSLYQPEFH